MQAFALHRKRILKRFLLYRGTWRPHAPTTRTPSLLGGAIPPSGSSVRDRQRRRLRRASLFCQTVLGAALWNSVETAIGRILPPDGLAEIHLRRRRSRTHRG